MPNVKLGFRDTDGSLMTKEQLKEANIKRFNEALASGNLYNTGPISEEGGTSFSPERWDIYFKSNPEDKPEGYTNQKDIQKKMDAGEDVTEELFGYEPLETQEIDGVWGTAEDDRRYRYYTYKGKDYDEWGNDIGDAHTLMQPGSSIDVLKDANITDKVWNSMSHSERINASEKAQKTGSPVQSRNLKGNRGPDGSLMAQEIAQDIETEKTIEADTYASGFSEFDTTVAGWITQFKQLSEEDFRAINDRDLKELGLNAIDAYYEVLDIHDDAEVLADKQAELDINRAEDQFDELDDEVETREMLKVWDAETKADDVAREDAEFDAELEDAESDRTMMEADADADKLDDDYEARTFPMMGMSDKEKGMFSFQKTDTIANKKEQDSINTIVGDTGMDEEQARQLMTKLKGICG